MSDGESKSAALPHQKEPAELVWSSGKDVIWMFPLGGVQLGGDPGDDPGHAEETTVREHLGEEEREEGGTCLIKLVPPVTRLWNKR